MTDIFLYSVPSDPDPDDVRLTDPTQLSSSGITGSGILLCAASAILGVALSLSTGTGSLSAQAATISGEGTVSTLLVITGEGTLVAQPASISGAGITKSTGTGVLSSQASSLSGVGIGRSTGSGALSAQAATTSGPGSAYWLARSEPYLNEDGVNHYLVEDGSGRYAIEEVRLKAQSSQLSGAGLSITTGTGALQAGNSTVSGSDASGSFTSMLAPWVGGAGASQVDAGYASLLGLWSGGAGSDGVTPPSVTPEIESGGVKYHRPRVIRLRDLDRKERETTAEYIKARLREREAEQTQRQVIPEPATAAKVSEIVSISEPSVVDKKTADQQLEDEIIALMLLSGIL